MLTRLHVEGFKSLLDVEVHFGPFTCIAGLNGAGKSNLFDAITLLHNLTRMPIMEAVQNLRETRERSSNSVDLFTKFEDYVAPEMRFTADMVVNRTAQDDFGVAKNAAISTLRYSVAFRRSKEDPSIIELADESLIPVKLSDARKMLAFPHHASFRNSVVDGRRTVDFISTSKENIEQPEITVHQEGHGGRKLPSPKSTRTVLGGLASSDFPTILAANREMAQWSTLMLEPSAMRAPSHYRDPRSIDARGGNLPNTVYRLIKSESTRDAVCAEIANKLSKLLGDVRAVRIKDDERSETRTLEIMGPDGVFHSARSLSDGTLRFLVLAVLDLDPEMRGIICLEEPENGIHPERIATMIGLLKDISVDPTMPVDRFNPLRQVVINTHSPAVVQGVEVGDLVYMGKEQVHHDGRRGVVAAAFAPPRSWRMSQSGKSRNLVIGQMRSYFGDPKPDESKPDDGGQWRLNFSTEHSVP